MPSTFSWQELRRGQPSSERFAARKGNHAVSAVVHDERRGSDVLDERRDISLVNRFEVARRHLVGCALSEDAGEMLSRGARRAGPVQAGQQLGRDVRALTQQVENW